MPFYGCPECGWATTASRSNAAHAHLRGEPDCGGELELIEDWQFPGDEPEQSAKREAPRQSETAAAARGA